MHYLANIGNILKINIGMTLTMSVSALTAFICSYFFKITLDNADQYLAVVAVIFMDGFFGIAAGIKREGFKTYKALRILKTLTAWIVILTVLLIVERGFPGTSWLSETVLIPLILFQIISSLKNAADAGYIKNQVLTKILEKIDRHKSFD